MYSECQLCLWSAVVGIADTRDDGGYWVVNSAGQVAACGDAALLGQPAALNRPIVGIAATSDGGGYYLVASDGGVFSYGDAAFQGSTGSIQTQYAGRGYGGRRSDRRLLVGGIRWRNLRYNAPFLGSTGSMTLNKPVVGMASAANGNGYWLVASDGRNLRVWSPILGIHGINAPK